MEKPAREIKLIEYHKKEWREMDTKLEWIECICFIGFAIEFIPAFLFAFAVLFVLEKALGYSLEFFLWCTIIAAGFEFFMWWPFIYFYREKREEIEQRKRDIISLYGVQESNSSKIVD